MKYSYILFLAFFSISLSQAQADLVINGNDLGDFPGNNIDTTFEIESVSISLEAYSTWEEINETEFWYSGTLYFDLSELESIDSVFLDYVHACFTCFDITFYKTNGDSIYIENPHF